MTMGRIRVFQLWFADLMCIYCTWAAVVWGYWAVGLGTYEPSFYLQVWPIGLAFTGLNALFRLYHGRPLYPAAPYSPVEEMRRLVGSAFLSHLLLISWLALVYQTTESYSRFVIILAGVLTAFLAQPVRDAMRAFLRKIDLGIVPVVIVGAGPTARRLADEFRHDAYWGFRPVGYFAAENAEIPGVERLGGLRDVVEVSRRLGVNIAFICRRQQPTRKEFESYSTQFTHVEYLPTSVDFPAFGSRLVTFSGVGGVEMANSHLMPALGVEKWILDKTLAIIAFALLSPFFIAVPLLIKLTSKGPVFYRQRRLGRYGKEIRVWKFRSMFADADARLKKILAEDPAAAAEWKTNFKLAHDPRITPLGNILRKTSIDELPQLFNVFAGDMSLVGPRPIVKDEVAYYGSSYRLFSSVPPGVTGLWQASGRSDTDYARRVALDVHYVLNWSPWLDIWIIIKTAFSVLLMRGAC